VSNFINVPFDPVAPIYIDPDIGPGWGWATMLLPQIEQTPLYNAMNFDLTIDHDANATGRLSSVSTFLCPSDDPTKTWVAWWRNPLDGSPIHPICELAVSNYVGMFGVSEPGINGEGVFFRNSQIGLRDITDGASQTLAVGERAHMIGWTTWVGSVPSAILIPPSGGVGRFKPEHGSGMVLGHAGEGKSPGDPRGDTNQFYSRHAGPGVNFLFADGHVAFLKTSMNYLTYRALATRAGGEPISAEY
jgi:prepilin-type processing-associated H-X9-DG protein